MKALPYTEAESEAATREWKAMCGHHSISAATGLPLERVKKSGVKLCGWMNPTMVSQCLAGMKMEYAFKPVSDEKDFYLEMVDGNEGKPRIFRVQFLGPWMNGPVAGQYRKTHYIACLNEGIVEPMLDPCKIIQHEEWVELALGMYPDCVKHSTGFRFTHAWSIPNPAR